MKFALFCSGCRCGEVLPGRPSDGNAVDRFVTTHVWHLSAEQMIQVLDVPEGTFWQHVPRVLN